jgi:hypothetical protein
VFTSKDKLEERFYKLRGKKEEKEERDSMFEKQIFDLQYVLSQMSEKQHNFHLIIVLDCSASM